MFAKSGTTIESLDVETLYKNERKKEAIRTAQKEYRNWFEQLQKSEDKLAFLDSLPFIGKITKYHLAKNLGIGDHSKPDVHLTRLQKVFGFPSVFEMTQYLSEKRNEKKAVVDIILWFYCEENPDYKEF